MESKYKVWIVILFFIDFHYTGGIVSVQEYCDKFDNYSIKPLICFLKTNPELANTPGWTSTTTTTTPSPSTTSGWGWGWDTDEDDDDDDESDCSCEVKCTPASMTIENNGMMMMRDEYDTFKYLRNTRQIINDPGTQCKTCGTDCPVNSFLNPRCSCAALGPSTSSAGARCRCTVACAQNSNSRDEAFCIYNVTEITRVRDSNRPYACDCDKSKATENNEIPEFACVCQPRF